MAKGRQKHREPKPAPAGPAPAPPGPSRWRRARRFVLPSATALAALALGASLYTWLAAPAPPAVSFGDADPAVVRAIEEARAEVWWRPRAAAAWGRLGQVLSAHAYKAEANRCFAQAERLDADDPRWPYLQGLSLQSDDPGAALDHLRRAVARCDREPDAPRLLLGELCLQQGQLDEADEHFQHILRHDPANARAHLGLGRLALARGRPRDAVAHLQRSAPGRLTQKASAVLLAQAHHQLGDKEAAAGARGRAVELPNDPPWPDPFLEEVQALRAGKQARLARLHTLQRQGRRDEALALARQLEYEYPDLYWLVEGREQRARGDLPAAARALAKAAELAPESVDAHFDLGQVRLEQGDYAAAAASFRRVTELEPSYGPAHLRLGRCLRQQGDAAAALRALQTAVRYMPHDAEARRELDEVSRRAPEK